MILKPMTKTDLELVLAWRSIPQIYQYLYTQKGLFTWEHHYDWFKTKKDRLDYVIMHENRRIGVVNAINLNTYCPELGVYIGEITLWGKGFATQAIKILIQKLKGRGYKKVCITTNKGNTRSIRLWEKLGFERKMEVKDGKEWFYYKEI